MPPNPRGKCLGAIVAFCAVATLATAVAIEPEDILIYSAGPLRFYPRFTLSESYNDNMFYRSSSTESDLVTRLNPGFTTRLGRREDRNFALSYNFTRVLYLDHSEQNSGDHSGTLNSHWEYERFRWDGADRIDFLTSILSGSRVRDAEADEIGSQKVDRLQFSNSHTFTYDMRRKTEVYFTGSHSSIDYASGTTYSDRNTLRGTWGLSYKYSPRTRIFSEFYYGQDAATPNNSPYRRPHVEYLGGFLGVRGEFTRRLSGSLRLGYESREFSDQRATPNQPVVNAQLDYLLSVLTRVSFFYNRRNSLSVSTDSDYVSDRVGLRVNQQLGTSGKWAAYVEGDFENRDYDIPRTDRDYGAGLGFSYNHDVWLRASLAYTFEQLDTEQPGAIGLEYQVNRIMLILSIGY